jgi:hypothetical protein
MKEGDIYYHEEHFDSGTYVTFYRIKKVWNKFVSIREVGKKKNVIFRQQGGFGVGAIYTVEPDLDVVIEDDELHGIFRIQPDKKFKIYSDDEGFFLKMD